jgi:hypothetical protein
MLGLACTLSMQCVVCHGQTNSCTPPSVLFYIPQARLRAEATAAPGKPEAGAASRPVFSAPPPSVALDLGDGAFHSRVVREGQFYLTQREPPADSGTARFVNKIFSPDIIRFGKVSVACPFVTAIKKKNPLCILSGLSTLTGDGQIDFKLLELSW